MKILPEPKRVCFGSIDTHWNIHDGLFACIQQPVPYPEICALIDLDLYFLPSTFN